MMKYYYVKLLLFFIHFFALLCKLFSSVNFIGLIRVIEGPFCLRAINDHISFVCEKAFMFERIMEKKSDDSKSDNNGKKKTILFGYIFSL